MAVKFWSNLFDPLLHHRSQFMGLCWGQTDGQYRLAYCRRGPPVTLALYVALSLGDRWAYSHRTRHRGSVTDESSAPSRGAQALDAVGALSVINAGVSPRRLRDAPVPAPGQVPDQGPLAAEQSLPLLQPGESRRLPDAGHPGKEVRPDGIVPRWHDEWGT